MHRKRKIVSDLTARNDSGGVQLHRTIPKESHASRKGLLRPQTVSRLLPHRPCRLRDRSESAVSVRSDFSRAPSLFVEVAARLSYLPMMDDSSEKKLRDATQSPTGMTNAFLIQRAHHISAIPIVIIIASFGSASLWFFFLRLRNEASRTPCLFSAERRIVIASVSRHFSHDSIARKPAAGQLRRELSKNRRHYPSARFFRMLELQFVADEPTDFQKRHIWHE